MPKLSIIIPVYNAGSYLTQCLDSVISQTFRDWEMIIIDDGSTDNSRLIIKGYAEKDRRIKTAFHETNQDVAVSRNDGLALAQGEFVAFVDADDWLKPEMYKKMIKRQKETGADIIECNFIHRVKMGRDYLELNNLPPRLNLRNDINAYFLNIYQHHLGIWIFNKIYRRSLIKENKIYFADNKRVQMEDWLFLLSLAPHVSVLAGVNRPYYNYRHHLGSLSRQKIPDLLEKTQAFLAHYADQQGNDNINKILPTLALIIIIQIKNILFHALIQEAHPIRAGAAALREAAQTKIIRRTLYYVLISRHTNIKDRLLAWLSYFRLYRLATLAFYLNMIKKRGRASKIYRP